MDVNTLALQIRGTQLQRRKLAPYSLARAAGFGFC